MKKIAAIIAAAAILLGAPLRADAKKVHTIGDSTMANYDENATVTRGWCQYLQQFLTGIEVNNRGKGGASSKSFYEEAAFWNTVKTQMQPGDIVLIQFAHNDEKTAGMDGDEVKAYYTSIGDNATAAATDYRGTTPYGTYKEYLRKYVDETRAAGCTPILVGPICRMYFSGNDIRRNGRHDLGDGFSKVTPEGILTNQKLPADDHTMDYVKNMQDVAAEKDVPFVDLTTATRDLFLSYGDADCHAILSDGDGSTHLSTVGATLIARQFVQLASQAGLLSEYANLSSEIALSPADGDMGKGYVGQQLTKEFLVSGFSLAPAAGTVTAAASEGLELSADGGQTWSAAAQLPYEGSTLIAKILARLTLAVAGTNTATITVTTQDGKSVATTLKAEAVELAGGVEVNAYWRLESDDKCVLTGPGEVIPESWHGMELQRYANPNANTTWPDWTGFDASRKTQRNLIEGTNWPANEIDEVSTRYIEFGLRAMAETTLAIDEISWFMCGCGGNGMCANVWYSDREDFSNARQIFHQTNMPANTMLYTKEVPVLELQPGQAVRLRVYPWYSSAASGKTICLSDIKIHGYARGGSGLTQADVKAEPVETVYYNLQGLRIERPASGLCIRRTTMADGSVTTSKIII